HCGTDLGLLRTRAAPADDGSYRLNGTKIFITAGEHDFTDNIVHLVLARLPDAPEGSRGISLFVVPKLQVNDDGSTGAPNGVRCGAIEHKMGIHGSATCVLNLDDAQGWLVGEPNRALMAVFTMMNSARVAVGVQGLGLADRAYQNALAYSRERLQMRSLSGPKFPDQAADPVIVAPDAADLQGAHRGRAGAVVLRRPAGRHHQPRSGRRRARARRRPARVPDPDHEGLPHRTGRGVHLQRPAVLGRPRLPRRARHGT